MMDMLAKLEETQGGDYDFVIADDYILELIREENLYQPLDTSKLKKIGRISIRCIRDSFMTLRMSSPFLMVQIFR